MPTLAPATAWPSSSRTVPVSVPVPLREAGSVKSATGATSALSAVPAK